jgi:hypothetical protein
LKEREGNAAADASNANQPMSAMKLDSPEFQRFSI